jgi:sulfur-oxidizing protein SoxX
MRNPARILTTASIIAALAGSLAFGPQVSAAEEKKEMTPAEMGKKVAENRKKGNCFGCHSYEGASLAGNIGPPLVAMKARFPDKAKLRAQVWDATKVNPDSLMPPFGRHEILSEKELDQVVEWLYTL